MILDQPAGAKLSAWYCPALGMYHRPSNILDKNTPASAVAAHLLAQFPWIPLYALAGPAADGWVLRAYFSPVDDSYYGSHRTMPTKAAEHPSLQPLYAPAGAQGNDTAAHVPAKAAGDRTQA